MQRRPAAILQGVVMSQNRHLEPAPESKSNELPLNPQVSCPVGSGLKPTAGIPLWDPRSDAMQRDQIAAYDAMRHSCTLAQSSYGYTSVFRHADVLQVVNDHIGFSSVVSRYPSVPNGMDPPQHTGFRKLIDYYFDQAHLDAFTPACHEISACLVDSLPESTEVEFIGSFAQIFALQIQCAWLGWPSSLHEPLRLWTLKNHTATLSRDRDAQEAVAREFDGYIKELLAERRHAGEHAPDDITTHLLRNKSLGRLLSEDEIISILRNWTVGELGTIAASVGIIAHFLSSRPQIQSQLRANFSLLPAAIDEILRIHPPLIMNRRVASKPVTLGGHPLETGTRLAVLWASANRDERVFGDPDEFRLDRNPELNLLYGAGVHVCPGAQLSRLELLSVTQALLSKTTWIAPSQQHTPVKAVYPGSGFASLFLQISKT